MRLQFTQPPGQIRNRQLRRSKASPPAVKVGGRPSQLQPRKSMKSPLAGSSKRRKLRRGRLARRACSASAGRALIIPRIHPRTGRHAGQAAQAKKKQKKKKTKKKKKKKKKKKTKTKKKQQKRKKIRKYISSAKPGWLPVPPPIAMARNQGDAPPRTGLRSTGCVIGRAGRRQRRIACLACTTDSRDSLDGKKGGHGDQTAEPVAPAGRIRRMIELRTIGPLDTRRNPIPSTRHPLLSNLSDGLTPPPAECLRVGCRYCPMVRISTGARRSPRFQQLVLALAQAKHQTGLGKCCARDPAFLKTDIERS